MEGDNMVDKTNMSLDDIIKMDRKKGLRGKPKYMNNKNTLARNVVKKAKNSFISRKFMVINKNFPQRKRLNISDKRQDIRNNLLRSKQMNNKTKFFPQNNNVQFKVPRNFFSRQNSRTLNIPNKTRLNRNNSNITGGNSPAFRITTNNERYQSNSSNQRERVIERQGNKRNYAASINNNLKSSAVKNNMNSRNNLNRQFSGGYRRALNTDNHSNYNRYQQISPRNNRSSFPSNRFLLSSRDREYEAMARALIQAHRQNSYTSSVHESPQRRYNPSSGSRGYFYRR